MFKILNITISNEILIGAMLAAFAVLFLFLVPVVKRLERKLYYEKKFDSSRNTNTKNGFVAFLSKIFNYVVGNEYKSKMDIMLLQANLNTKTSEDIMIYTGIAMAVFPIIFVFLTIIMALDSSIFLLAVVGGVIFGFIFPKLYLQNLIDHRKKEIESSLLSYTEQLFTSVDAGLSIDRAVKRISQYSKSILAQEFSRTWDDFQKIEVSEAFQNFKERCCNISELRILIDSIEQTIETGTPMSKTLQGQIAALRANMRNRIVTKGEQAKVKMLVPMMLFMFPSFMMVVIIPSAVTFIQYYVG